jgi:hypothetical protein
MVWAVFEAGYELGHSPLITSVGAETVIAPEW